MFEVMFPMILDNRDTYVPRRRTRPSSRTRAALPRCSGARLERNARLVALTQRTPRAGATARLRPRHLVYMCHALMEQTLERVQRWAGVGADKAPINKQWGTLYVAKLMRGTKGLETRAIRVPDVLVQGQREGGRSLWAGVMFA